jgi:hypothetical protein
VILVVGALDTPVNKLASAFHTHKKTPPTGRRLTPELYDALTWIRSHSDSQAVIAVNNAEALEFGYAAFAERRIFLGGWGYSLRSRDDGFAGVVLGLQSGSAGRGGINLYAGRAALNDAVFMHGSGAALARMAGTYGVRYLLIDQVNGYRSDVRALMRFGRPVFAARRVLVLEVRKGRIA